jgi:hypothetical protein
VGRVPPFSPQPSIVEAELEAKEYWYETFRRVLVIPDGSGCYLISIDVHSLGKPSGEEAGVMEAPGVKLRYLSVPASEFKVGDVEPLSAEVVVVETGERVETVNLRLRYCGLKEAPGYSVVETLYRKAVMLIEGRDPEREPLTPPEPVERVYKARGLAKPRRRR